jgi:hypothetical protein
MSFPGCCSSGINPDNIIYFDLFHNQGGRFKIISKFGNVLCMLLFMNGFMPSVLIAIQIFLISMENSRFHESMFHHCVASLECVIIPKSCLWFQNPAYASLCAIATIWLLVCKPTLQMSNDWKVPKHLSGLSFLLLQLLSSPLSFIRLNRSSPQIGHFSRSSYSAPWYRMQSFLYACIFTTSKPNSRLSILPHKWSQGLCLLGVTSPLGALTSS